jgi:hypothetical protein
MSYAIIHDAAVAADSTLRKQITVAIAKAATDIFNENPATNGHERRMVWARQVQTSSGRSQMADAMVWKVLENATIQASPATATDSDVQFVVNSLVNQFAGE